MVAVRSGVTATVEASHQLYSLHRTKGDQVPSAATMMSAIWRLAVPSP